MASTSDVEAQLAAMKAEIGAGTQAPAIESGAVSTPALQGSPATAESETEAQR
jgi:hypothetical protein